MLFNSSDGKCYLFKEPYVRTSSKKYVEYDSSLPNEDQIFMQLTNNAIQKNGEEYGIYEEGNITSIGTLFEQIANDQGKSRDDVQDKFFKDANNLIIDSFKAVKGKLLSQKHTFELFGYDFILDEQMNTILIEVNTNPSLDESNTLLRTMMPRMMDDLLHIVMDPLFGDKNEQGRYRSTFKLPGAVFDGKEDKHKHPGYKDDESTWKLIYTMEQW